ncbi:MAG: Heimdall-CTERM domain-containing surface protein [Promethearchaeota archaeon]
MYNYTLRLTGLVKLISILHYWSASDLAYPRNMATDGSQENPYYFFIHSKETQTTTIYETITNFIEPIPTTSETTSSQIVLGESTVGFEIVMPILTLGMIIIFYRRRK